MQEQCQICQVAFFALFMLLKNFVQAIRLRRQEIDLHTGNHEESSPQAKLLKHRKNKERTKRAIHGTLLVDGWVLSGCVHGTIQDLAGIYSSMLVAVAENLPLGILMVIM